MSIVVWSPSIAFISRIQNGELPHTPLIFFSYAHNAFTSPITPSFGLKYILNDDDGWRLLWGEGVGGRQIDADDSSLRVFIGVGVIERFFLYISPP